ncbi:hypothetical protein SORBI_3003G032400 [Sorghum bicolor]|nr:hypothetical protein SORBI_3003G032400 [Sorghum bicolor]
MGGKGMEIHQVFRPAPPPLRPAAVRNLESWRCFSTGGGEPKGKADSFMRLWQWAKYRVENAGPVAKTRAVSLYVLVAIGTPTLYMMNTVRNWRPSP